ncbi:MAG: hypothetical protein IJM32_06680 [Ruminococcus sp.]|jgi:hypothetical protein|nr:hypothetical protein [Ruminococcus sp.]
MKKFMMKRMLKAHNKVVSLKTDNRGVDIIVMIIVLAILVAIALIFRDTITEFVKKVLGDIIKDFTG